MIDIVSKKTRSRMMASIGSREHQTRGANEKHLHSQGFRFRLHKKVCGSAQYRTAQNTAPAFFVHGCFWHRRRLQASQHTKNQTGILEAKFQSNVARDRRVARRLELNGWRVVVIWECEVRNGSFTEDRLRKAVQRGTPTSEFQIS